MGGLKQCFVGVIEGAPGERGAGLLLLFEFGVLSTLEFEESRFEVS